MLIRALALASVIGAAACASEGGAFLPGDDPGTGTGTLRVVASAVATPRFPNATADADYDTAFRVQVDKADARVRTGTITVASVAGSVTLALDTRAGGMWLGSQAGYHEIYVLDLENGDDAVYGVRIDGPDRHAFTAPLPGATVDATRPLAVTWSRRDTATLATLHTDGAGDEEVPDTGAYTLPAGGLASAPDHAVDEELRLDRRSQVVPAGAVTDSTWSVTVTNTIKLVVAPTQ